MYSYEIWYFGSVVGGDREDHYDYDLPEEVFEAANDELASILEDEGWEKDDIEDFEIRYFKDGDEIDINWNGKEINYEF